MTQHSNHSILTANRNFSKIAVFDEKVLAKNVLPYAQLNNWNTNKQVAQSILPDQKCEIILFIPAVSLIPRVILIVFVLFKLNVAKHYVECMLIKFSL